MDNDIKREEKPKMSLSLNSRKFIDAIGNILVIISFAFIVHKINTYQINFKEIFSFLTLSVLTISFIVYSLLVLYYASLFSKILNFIDENQCSKTDAMFTYCKSNLYKYLPGNIFHYIGRNQIAIIQTVSHGTVIAASIAEILLMFLAALVIIAAFSGKEAIKWIQSNMLSAKTIFIIAVVFLCCMLPCLFSCRNKIIKERVEKYKKIINSIGFYKVLRLVVAYIAIFVLNSVMFFVLLYSMCGELRINLIAPVIGMYTLSWLIGFITPGAPAGLGIREVIMSTLLNGVVSGELVIAAVLLYRIITIIGDVGGFFIAYSLYHKQVDDSLI